MYETRSSNEWVLSLDTRPEAVILPKHLRVLSSSRSTCEKSYAILFSSFHAHTIKCCSNKCMHDILAARTAAKTMQNVQCERTRCGEGRLGTHKVLHNGWERRKLISGLVKYSRNGRKHAYASPTFSALFIFLWHIRTHDRAQSTRIRDYNLILHTN